jgi:DNA repair protein RadC
MARLGPRVLSDAEVVAILLGTGRSGESALQLAQRIVSLSESMFGTSLGFLTNACDEEIRVVSGIGPAKVARLRAAAEIARRLRHAQETGGKPVTVRQGKEVYEYVRSNVEGLDREHFWILTLNARHQITGMELISIGSLDASIVHPREIFRNCIKKSAKAIILVHNHPSGDPTPSDDDMDVTRRLVEAGHLLGIHVLDHVVVSARSYISIRELSPGLF